MEHEFTRFTISIQGRKPQLYLQNYNNNYNLYCAKGLHFSAFTCNGKNIVSEPGWTWVRSSLKQKSIINYIITYAQFLEVSWNVYTDG